MRSLFLLAALSACGHHDSAPPPPAPSVPPKPWAEIAVIIKADCGGCHDGLKQPKLTPEVIFLTSDAEARLKAGTMPPPPMIIPEADKAALLSFLGT